MAGVSIFVKGGTFVGALSCIRIWARLQYVNKDEKLENLDRDWVGMMSYYRTKFLLYIF